MRKKVLRFAVAAFCLAVASTVTAKAGLAEGACPSFIMLDVGDGTWCPGSWPCTWAGGLGCAQCFYDCGEAIDECVGDPYVHVNMCQS